MESQKKEHIIKYKMIYTILILLVYFLGKNLPLYGVDFVAYINKNPDAEALLEQTIGGDLHQCSLFALGIAPHMISTMLVQIITLSKSSEAKARTSPRKTNRTALGLTLVLATIQALLHVQKLQFRVDESLLLMAKSIAAVEMVTGAVFIIWLSSRNKRYGIGGQTTLISINIVENIIMTLREHSIVSLIVPVLISLVVMLIVVLMENTEKRIPVQRISIHNIYADKNYLAIKLNPIGVMPAMFSMAFFMLPQLILGGLNWLMPKNSTVLWWQDNMELSKPLGIAVYIIILYLLTVGFSRVFINPKDTTEQFLKSGDSILNLHAGRDTKRYLSRTINRISFLSATVMSICIGVPLLLQLVGGIDTTLVMLPSSVMMMTGMWCNLYREFIAIRNLETYKPFI